MAKRGRPKLEVTKCEVVQLRVLPHVKEELMQAARIRKQSVTKWATDLLSKAAHEVLQNNRQKSDDST